MWLIRIEMSFEERIDSHKTGYPIRHPRLDFETACGNDDHQERATEAGGVPISAALGPCHMARASDKRP